MAKRGVHYLMMRAKLAAVTYLTLLLVAAVPAAHAARAQSIPIIGRYASLTIGITVPATPTWAHDLVLNASASWNLAQVWYNQKASLRGSTYTFTETADGPARISFSMPKAYSSFAVGWTDYQFDTQPEHTILSTKTYFTASVFAPESGSNATSRNYAFQLALHELGRILGLGSVFDGEDIMDPRFDPSSRSTWSPLLSAIDLYAVHVLASGLAPSFVTLPGGLPDLAVDAQTLASKQHAIATPEFNLFQDLLAAVSVISVFALSLQRKRSLT